MDSLHPGMSNSQTYMLYETVRIPEDYRPCAKSVTMVSQTSCVNHRTSTTVDSFGAQVQTIDNLRREIGLRDDEQRSVMPVFFSSWTQKKEERAFM